MDDDHEAAAIAALQRALKRAGITGPLTEREEELFKQGVVTGILMTSTGPDSQDTAHDIELLTEGAVEGTDYLKIEALGMGSTVNARLRRLSITTFLILQGVLTSTLLNAGLSRKEIRELDRRFRRRGLTRPNPIDLDDEDGEG